MAWGRMWPSQKEAKQEQSCFVGCWHHPPSPTGADSQSASVGCAPVSTQPHPGHDQSSSYPSLLNKTETKDGSHVYGSERTGSGAWGQLTRGSCLLNPSLLAVLLMNALPLLRQFPFLCSPGFQQISYRPGPLSQNENSTSWQSPSKQMSHCERREHLYKLIGPI